MLSSSLRPAINRLVDPAAAVLARTPLTPDALTIIGTIGMSAAALALFPTGHLFAGTMVCTFFVLADTFDGALARAKGTTSVFGGFLDSTLDRIGDASVFSGLAAWFIFGGHSRLLAGVALFCLVAGSLVSYAKARAQSLGLRCDVGFAERAERLLIVLVAAGLSGLGVPYVLPAGLWVLAAASVVTFGQRVHAVHKEAVLKQAANKQAEAAPAAAQAQPSRAAQEAEPSGAQQGPARAAEQSQAGADTGGGR